MRISSTLIVLLLAAGLAACAQSRQASEVERSGFLGDYSKLESGGEGEFALRYVSQDADWASFDKIMLDQISFWRGQDEEEVVPAEDRQRLANNLYTLLYKELSKDYTMVSAPEPGAMRIQVALTSVEASNATLDVVSTVIPVGLVVTSATEFATGEPTFGGGATIEAKITDSVSGDILGAGVDKRVGGKDLEGAFDSWDDVNAAFVYWSQRGRFNLCVLRGDTDCVEPTTN